MRSPSACVGPVVAGGLLSRVHALDTLCCGGRTRFASCALRLYVDELGFGGRACVRSATAAASFVWLCLFAVFHML